MATVHGRGPRGEVTVITVLARGDQVLVRVGTGPAVLLAVEQAGDLLRALRTEFDQAASSMLDAALAPGTGRGSAAPGNTSERRHAMSNERKEELMALTPLLPAPTHADPLATAAERFPLGWPRSGQPANAEAASPTGVRPFGLRFAVEPSGQTAPLPRWRYCLDRQIALGMDGKPWHRLLVDMTMKTTGPSPDGGGSTGGEEWSPDFMSDEPAEPI